MYSNILYLSFPSDVIDVVHGITCIFRAGFFSVCLRNFFSGGMCLFLSWERVRHMFLPVFSGYKRKGRSPIARQMFYVMARMDKLKLYLGCVDTRGYALKNIIPQESGVITFDHFSYFFFWHRRRECIRRSEQKTRDHYRLWNRTFKGTPRGWLRYALLLKVRVHRADRKRHRSS